MTEAMQNVDSAELAKFALRAEEWWDTKGAFKTLHDINPLRLRYITERAVLRNARVLDVGCGGGLLSEAMAREGAAVIGIDMAQENLTAAREHAAGTALSIDYRRLGVEELAAEEPASFDVVTCLEVLEHVPDPAAIVAACAKAVRPGGEVFFSTINRNLKSYVLAVIGAEYLLRMVPKGTHEYLKLIRPAELARWCRAAGLAIHDLRGLHFNPLLQEYSLGGNVDVNYFVHAGKAANG